MASEIKANKISPATGTAFTIGDSGDTFTVPSGATLNVASGGTISNSGTASGLGGGKVLQIVQTVVSSITSTNSTSFVDLAGMTVDITPSATTSKVLVLPTLQGGGAAFIWKITRDTTDIGIGDAAGSRNRGAFGSRDIDTAEMKSTSICYLDSPSSTSAVTYKIQYKCRVSGGGYARLNHDNADTDDAAYTRGCSTITVIEIGA